MGQGGGVVMDVLGQADGDGWTLYHGDSCEVVKGLPDESIDFSMFSPPYLSMYVYSDSIRDMGNCGSADEFYSHFRFLVGELLRVVKPGRIVAVDCMNVPAMKERDGFIGLKDFRGDLIYLFQQAGFIFHSEHCMWKDPLVEATRTKALGLMHKQLCKDSSMSRAGIPQYILGFRKPGKNAEPIAHADGLTSFAGEDAPERGVLSHERWRRYASPVWMDVDFTNTLNAVAGRAASDERHICPMSLDAIERCLTLWSNPGDVVLDPFNGIGSTGCKSVEMGRKYIGIELKESYFLQAAKNLQRASSLSSQKSILDLAEVA